MVINWFLDLVYEKLREYDKSKKYQKDSEEAWDRACIDVLTDLMETQFEVNDKDEDGETIIKSSICSSKNDLAISKSLIEAGADVNIRDFQGYTALDHAKAVRHSEIVKLLLEVGAV
jgi:ankyrin repeat protein